MQTGTLKVRFFPTRWHHHLEHRSRLRALQQRLCSLRRHRRRLRQRQEVGVLVPHQEVPADGLHRLRGCLLEGVPGIRGGRFRHGLPHEKVPKVKKEHVIIIQPCFIQLGFFIVGLYLMLLFGNKSTLARSCRCCCFVRIRLSGKPNGYSSMMILL